MKRKHRALSSIIFIAIVAAFATLPMYPAVVGSNGKEAIAAYAFESPGWATFGIVVPMGKAYDGLKVGDLATQNDVKNRWSDGSIRYAILTVYIDNPDSYEIYENFATTGSFAPIVPAARLELNIEGTALYVSDLPGPASGDLWLDGPFVKEWRVRDIPSLNGIEHPFLSNIWDIRIYNDATGTVDVAVENIRDVAEADGVVYGANIIVDGTIAYHHEMSRPGKNPISFYGGAYGTSYYSLDNELTRGNFIRITSGPASGTVGCVYGFNNSLTPRGDHIIDIPGALLSGGSSDGESWETVFYHQYGARWRKTVDVGAFVKSTVITDFAPFIEANAIPEYMPNVYSTADLVGYGDWEGADPLGFSSLYVGMTATGGRPELGPYPRWAARFIVHQTPELREQTLTLGNLAGSWAMHFAKNDPSRMVTLVENPNYFLDTRAGPNDKPLNNLKGAINLFYNSHAPSYVYIPYLVTGDRYYSDEMMFRANHAIMSTYPGYVEPGAIFRSTEGMLWNNQMRAIAWGLRDLADAAFYLPDGSQYKGYFERIVANNLRGMDELVRETHSPLGFVRMGNSFEANGDMRTAPWMGAYLVWSLQHTIEQRADTNDDPGLGAVVRDSMLKYLFQPAIEETDFPPEYLPGYWILNGRRVGSYGVVAEFYDTWKELYERNWLNPDGTPMPIPDWGYGLDLRLALIAGKRAGYPGIDKAYDFFMEMLGDPSRNLLARLPEGTAFAFADYIAKNDDTPTQPEPTPTPTAPEPTPTPTLTEPEPTPTQPEFTPTPPEPTPSNPSTDNGDNENGSNEAGNSSGGGGNGGSGVGRNGGGGANGVGGSGGNDGSGGGGNEGAGSPSAAPPISDTETGATATGDTSVSASASHDSSTDIGENPIPGSEASYANPFEDVNESDWFYDYVMNMYSRGLMIGTYTDPMLFSPNIPTTRAMIVTVLYRIEIAANTTNSTNADDHIRESTVFTDVPEGAWYYEAIQWAAKRGIVEGYGGGLFGPNDNITRQDLAAIFLRHANYFGIELPAIRNYSGFADDSDIADYAKNAIQRLYSAEIIIGKPGNLFDPKSEATRAECATMFTKFISIGSISSPQSLSHW